MNWCIRLVRFNRANPNLTPFGHTHFFILQRQQVPNTLAYYEKACEVYSTSLSPLQIKIDDAKAGSLQNQTYQRIENKQLGSTKMYPIYQRTVMRWLYESSIK